MSVRKHLKKLHHIPIGVMILVMKTKTANVTAEQIPGRYIYENISLETENSKTTLDERTCSILHMMNYFSQVIK